MDRPPIEEDWQAADAYHELTKHHFHRYAASPGYLDWKHQPDPFRRFAGASLTKLPFASESDSPTYDQLVTGSGIAPSSVESQSLGAFLETSLGLTAWKSTGIDTWALRANPSSGNLHPTEAYLVLGAVEGVGERPGVYHYCPKEHGLECRLSFPGELWRTLTADLPGGSFLVGLTSIHWREAWKYGVRAYRYCQHDVGHALACLRLSAARLGWSLRVLEDLGDDEVAALLGVDRDQEFPSEDREVPALLAVVTPRVEDEGSTATLDRKAVPALVAGDWSGVANELSSQHVDWEVLEIVSQACAKPGTEPKAIAEQGTSTATFEAPSFPDRHRNAVRLFRSRRSAVAMDGETSIEKEDFFRLLARTVPAKGIAPWDAIVWRPSVHLALFVHRVNGLTPGLYMLVRHRNDGAAIRESLHDEFLWRTVPEAPPGLDLLLLREGDAQKVSTQVSCLQGIAGEGAFSLGMLADWGRLREEGAWFYRRFFWESGMIGQVLYLEAEAAGVRATGIGCFFDDPVHELFGVKERRFQSVYHFTVGGAVDDNRLQTWPAYPDRS
ncbi:Nitroreductase family protein [Planctomycetes bacterium Pan216]|uniref:Nitroreductase family protein n=1 Tax=Kolteria novifilia TaxID=2527975 RepID=A0A518B108_9BACT|nr:Nitroreductase family protein [Planctomycetes bacterium Pan216]